MECSFFIFEESWNLSEIKPEKFRSKGKCGVYKGG
ncbi:hypothetical protein BACSP_01261 [Bacillus sp. T2.9-1]|nr:hypothetical protein BACSP_01261 [Bacillus sp. T2.9-1]